MKHLPGCLGPIALFFLTSFCQLSATAQAPPPGVPDVIDECDVSQNGDSCTTWRWNGQDFDGQWPNGQVGIMKVVRFGQTGVFISRSDPSGASAGLTATYLGKVDGYRIVQGTVVWNRGGRSTRGTWTGTFGPGVGGGSPPPPPADAPAAGEPSPPGYAADPSAPPPQTSALANDGGMRSTMNECETGNGGSNCASWSFVGRQGSGQSQTGAVENLQVENFADGRVVIHRSDPGGSSPGLVATYTGVRHGNRLSGDVSWVWPGHWDGAAYGTWSATMQSMPPRNGVLTLQQHQNCYPWFYTVVCE